MLSSSEALKMLRDEREAFLKKLDELCTKIGVKFDQEIFVNHLSLMGVAVNPQAIIKKMELLVNLVTEVQGDFDAKRDAFYLLKNVNAIETVAYLVDAKDYLNTLLKAKHESSDYDQVVVSLNACLAGATQIAESLFNDKLNPAAHHYILSYAICSRDVNWVKQLIEKWHVDISQDKYCFRIYAERLSLEELLQLYQLKITDMQKSAKGYQVSAGTIFFSPSNSQNKSTTLAKIPPPLLEITADGLLGVWETMQEFNEADQRLILAILQNKDLTPEQATRAIRQIEINGGLPDVLSSSFDILFCAHHIKRWDNIKNKTHKQSFIDNIAKVALGKDASTADHKAAEEQLKVHAYKQVSKLLAAIPKSSQCLSKEENSKYDAL